MIAQLCIRGLIATIVLSTLVIMTSMMSIMPQFSSRHAQSGAPKMAIVALFVAAS